MWGNMGITPFIHNFGAVWRSMILTLHLFYPQRNSTHFIQGWVGRPDSVNTLQRNICLDRMLIHCLITLCLVTADWCTHCRSLTAHCLVTADWSTHCLRLIAHCLVTSDCSTHYLSRTAFCLVIADWSTHCLRLTAYCLVTADWSTDCLSLIAHWIVTANWSTHRLIPSSHCLVTADWSTQSRSLTVLCVIYWLNHSLQPNDPMFSISSMKFANAVFFEFVRFCPGQ